MFIPKIKQTVLMDPGVYLITLPFQVLILAVAFIVVNLAIGCFKLMYWLVPLIWAGSLWLARQSYDAAKILYLYIRRRVMEYRVGKRV